MLAYYAGTLYGTMTANLGLSVYILAYVPTCLGYTFTIERVPYLGLAAAETLPTMSSLAVTFSGVTSSFLLPAVFFAGDSIAGDLPTLSAYAIETASEYSGPFNTLTNGATDIGLATAPGCCRS